MPIDAEGGQVNEAVPQDNSRGDQEILEGIEDMRELIIYNSEAEPEEHAEET